jgi:hypothetical protein
MPASDPSASRSTWATILPSARRASKERPSSAPARPRTRSPLSTSPEFAAALTDQHVQALHTIEIEGAVEQPGAAPTGVRSTSHGEDAIVLEAPAVAPGWAQVVFMQDECGVITWNFAEPGESGTVTRVTATQKFLLRRYVPSPPAAGDTHRGLSGAIGTKVFKILAFPIQAVAGRVGTHLANEWESVTARMACASSIQPRTQRMVPGSRSNRTTGAHSTGRCWFSFTERSAAVRARLGPSRRSCSPSFAPRTTAASSPSTIRR